MHAVDRDAVLARLVLRDFGDERFEVGRRRGNFDVAIGALVEEQDDVAVGILALVEMTPLRAESERSTAAGPTESGGSVEVKRVDFEGGGCLAGDRWAAAADSRGGGRHRGRR